MPEKMIDQLINIFFLVHLGYAGCPTSTFMTCLTCTLLPCPRSGQSLESSTASSRSFALMIKKPPTTSLPSVYGPSVTVLPFVPLTNFPPGNKGSPATYLLAAFNLPIHAIHLPICSCMCSGLRLPG